MLSGCRRKSNVERPKKKKRPPQQIEKRDRARPHWRTRTGHLIDVKMIADFPSGVIFRTRGIHSSRSSPAVWLYSSTWTMSPKTATSVGAHGLSSWSIVVTRPSAATFNTRASAESATYTTPLPSTFSPRRYGRSSIPGVAGRSASAVIVAMVQFAKIFYGGFA